MAKDTAKQKDRLEVLAQKGFCGYPIATVAFYGPTSKLATKIAVAIVVSDDQENIIMKKWCSEDSDVRTHDEFKSQILEFIPRKLGPSGAGLVLISRDKTRELAPEFLIKQHNARSVVISDGIMGCPHEEGIDYLPGESCPLCPHWGNRDRFLDEVIQ